MVRAMVACVAAKEGFLRKGLKIFGGLILLAAVGAVVAVVMGAAPIVSDCLGDPPSGAFVVYRQTTADGNCLQGYVWAPAGPARAALVVVHGLGDHARRYDALAGSLNAAGIAVVAQDHRGHGGSGGGRQRLDSVEQLVDDVGVALKEARARFPGLPIVLHGHSMGGMVAAQVLARSDHGLAGGVISSAALKLPVGASEGQVWVVSAISAVAPNQGLEALEGSKIVRQSAAREALAADPLISREKLPARTLATLLGGALDIGTRMAAIKVPILILHGQADPVTDPAGSRLLQEQAGSAVKILREYSAAQHDLLHEPEGAEVAREVTDFVSGLASQKS